MIQINLLMVDDHVLVRDSISARLKLENNLNIVGYAENGQEAIEKILDLQPDVVLMDITMPLMGGFEATTKITSNWNNIKVLILSMHDKPEYAKKIIQSGASGYVLKSASIEELILAINTVYQGKKYISPDILSSMLDLPANQGVLTCRETEVLCNIAKGLADKENARELDISVRTIETHKQNIKKKLDIHTIAGLVLYASQNDLCCSEHT